MTQNLSESALGVSNQGATTGGAVPLRILQVVVAQANGTVMAVNVDPTYLLDPDTGQPFRSMTESQADRIIGLLERAVFLLERMSDP